MLLKVIGTVMILDGVMSAMSVLPMIDTFIYRSWRDQSLVVAHIIVGALSVLVGRLLLKRDRDSFPENKIGSFFPCATVVAALAISGLEVTQFDWPVFALRAGYTAAVLTVLLWPRK